MPHYAELVQKVIELPPGPPLPKLVQLALMMLFWPRYVAACGRRYGKVFTLRFASMGTWVYLADPTDIKTVFAGDSTIYHAGEANAVMAGLLGDSSVLVIDEELHRDRRGLMLAPFQRDAVTAQAELMADVAKADIECWPVGTEFPVGPRMSKITLDVILRTVIGSTDPARLAALREVMPRLLNMGAWDTVALTKPDLLRRWPWRGVRRRIEDADRLLYAEIADRRVDPNLATRTDMLAKLIGAADQDGRKISDKELRDQLVTLLFAGHDTTATSLSWALERLTRHPAALDKAVWAAEASAAGDPEGDAYLDAISKETLRIRPVAFEAVRVLTRPVEFAGYRLPAGVIVATAIGLVHRNADLYTNPDQFNPDRMLGASLSPTTWLPFGGGNRRCLGATFAMVEMRTVLREILRRVELTTTTAASERPKMKNMIIVPHRGGRIRLRALRQVATASPTTVHSVSCPVTGGNAKTRSAGSRDSA
jgi:cytochrome P450